MLSNLSDQSQAGPEPAPPGKSNTRRTAPEIARNVLKRAETERGRPSGALFWSSLAAGLVIGFSFVMGGYLMSLSPGAHRPALAALAYPAGFIVVVLARQELFTENTMPPALAVFVDRSRAAFGAMLRTWSILLVGNLLGTLLFALALVHTPLLQPALHADLLELGRHATSGSFGTILWEAVFAGWLIALLSWLVASTEDAIAQIALVFLITWIIGALGFTHSIVGASEAFYLAARGAAGWGEMLGGFLLPAIVGNAVGGVVLVGLLNYGQVSEEV